MLCWKQCICWSDYLQRKYVTHQFISKFIVNKREIWMEHTQGTNALHKGKISRPSWLVPWQIHRGFVSLSIRRNPRVWNLTLPIISRQSAHAGGMASHTHGPPLPPTRYSWYSFLLQAESTPGPLCGRKD